MCCTPKGCKLLIRQGQEYGQWQLLFAARSVGMPAARIHSHFQFWKINPCCCCLQVVEVRDVRVRDCGRRVGTGSAKNQMQGALEDWEGWLEFEVKREG